MGKRGPAKKTAQELKESGSWRGKLKPGEVELERPVSGKASQEPPEWLDEDSLKIWDEFGPKAMEMKTFKNADTFSFGLFCKAASELIKVLKQLDATGYVYEAVYYSKDGDEQVSPKTHPLVAVVKSLRDDYNKYAMEFGFNPLSRTKLMIVPYDVNEDKDTGPGPIDEKNYLAMMGLNKKS